VRAQVGNLCHSHGGKPRRKQETPTVAEIVIAYFSRTGRTRMVAETLAELLGADLEEIRERKARRGLLGAIGAGIAAFRGRAGTLATRHTVEGRSAVVLGTPVWAGRPVPAVRAYVEAVELEGRKVFAFCTYDGGPGKTMEALEEMVPGGLAASLGLRKPAKDEGLDAKLKDFAKTIKAALAET
jgi:flavodoxin